MKSKLKLTGFMPLSISLVLIYAIISISSELFQASIQLQEMIPLLITIIFFLFVLTWLLFGEFKNKMAIVRFKDNNISVRKMGGLLPKREFNFDQIEGWKYSILPSRNRDYEYLYIYSKGKKVAKISQFYHKNYSEIKQYVIANYNNLGYEEFSYVKEFREIFE